MVLLLKILNDLGDIPGGQDFLRRGFGVAKLCGCPAQTRREKNAIYTMPLNRAMDDRSFSHKEGDTKRFENILPKGLSLCHAAFLSYQLNAESLALRAPNRPKMEE